MVNAVGGEVLMGMGSSQNVTRDGWTGRLWAEAAGIYGAILEHPFLAGLTGGTLEPAAFAHYVVQDAHYLRDFARALAVVGSKAPTHTDTGMFARHAAGTVDVELALHASLLPQLGLDASAAAETPVAPTTQAYTSYLLAAAHGGSFAEGLAAVLPCYWIYAEVGAELVKRGSPDARYQRWIDTYAGDEYTAIVAEVLELADRIGTLLARDDEARARHHFVTTARYEWMFWDAAWRREAWPV
jgi:thiaminase/transcriptional activator TenA